MNISSLKKIIKDGESEHLEFKKSTGLLNEVGETLCGFLNTEGGRVIVRQAIIIEALPIGEPPFIFNNRAYERIQNTTQYLSQQKYEALLFKRNNYQYNWEKIVTEATVDDLNQEQVLGTVRRGIENGRLPESSGQDISDLVIKLGLTTNEKLNNAATVLFGPNNISQHLLMLARFKGVDKTEFIDSRQEYGNAFHLLDEGILFLKRHLPIAGKIHYGDIERKDQLLFPLEALREALVNALCHRDYSTSGMSISIAIFDDRLEIWSPGTLPSGIKIDDLKIEHRSVRRNEIISSVFYRCGLVEQWGRGTQKIISLCKQAGHSSPDFFEQSGHFVVRFNNREYISKENSVALSVTARQKEILNILSSGPYALREIINKLSSQTPYDTVKDDLTTLKRLDLIEYAGKGRSAKWRLKN